MINKKKTESEELEVEASKKERLVKVFQMESLKDKRSFLIGLLIVLMGIGSGWLLAGKKTSGGILKSEGKTSIPRGTEVGSEDLETFRDVATGVVERGGFEGEGSHKLIREGGPSQTVYLTSSIVNLDDFIGHKVKIWGETFAGQKAGWLMDVGRVKVLE